MSTSSATSAATSGTQGADVSNTLGSGEGAPIIAPPYAAVNVKHHVPVMLELAHPNYNKWAAAFTSLCGKFYLSSHVDDSLAPAPTDASWVAMDCAVRGWIYGSVANDVLDLAMAPEQTARDLWVAIADMFQANKVLRAVFLAEQFQSMTQGDLSIDQFCQCMKQTADSLRDVGHTILDSQLVLNLLRGLNPRYSSTADDIVNKDVLPSFAAARCRELD